MEYKYKNIHIGSLIKEVFMERKMEEDRVCELLKITTKQLSNIFENESVDTKILLRISKLFEYDFFRIYSQHLLLYAPKSKNLDKIDNSPISRIPQFRKNLYTEEIIEFIIELIVTNKKSINQVISEYHIPRTTVYRWLEKHRTENESEL